LSTQNSQPSIARGIFFNHVEHQFGKKINQIRSDNGGEYIRDEMKVFFLTSRVIHDLKPA
jgi:hypothetical protein